MAPIDLQREAETLKQLSRQWSAQAARGNIDAVVDFWDDDAVLMQPGLASLHGKRAIRQQVESAMRAGLKIRWEPLSVHVARSGDLAYMIERNVATFNDPAGKPITTHGKVVTVWKKNNHGEWKNVVDIWNDEPPPT